MEELHQRLHVELVLHLFTSHWLYAVRLTLTRVCAVCVFSNGELIRLLVILVQIGQNFAITWWTMKVELRVILWEQRLHMTLRIRSHHAFFHLVLVAFTSWGSKLEVLILVQVTLLNKWVILLEEILLAIGRLASLTCTRRHSSCLFVEFLNLILFVFRFRTKCFAYNLVHSWSLL